MIDTSPLSPLLIARIPVDYTFVPMSMTERAVYVRKMGWDDPNRTRESLHSQFVQEMEQRQLRQIRNSTALSQRIAYKRGTDVPRNF